MLKKFLLISFICKSKAEISHNIFIESELWQYKRVNTNFGISPFLNYSNNQSMMIKGYITLSFRMYNNVHFFFQNHMSRDNYLDCYTGIYIVFHQFTILVGGWKNKGTIQIKWILPDNWIKKIPRKISILYSGNGNQSLINHTKITSSYIRKVDQIAEKIINQQESNDQSALQLQTDSTIELKRYNHLPIHPIFYMSQEINKEAEFWHHFIQGKKNLSAFGATLTKDVNLANNSSEKEVEETINSSNHQRTVNKKEDNATKKINTVKQKEKTDSSNISSSKTKKIDPTKKKTKKIASNNTTKEINESEQLAILLIEMVSASKIIYSNIFGVSYKGRTYNNEDVIKIVEQFKEINLKGFKDNQSIFDILSQLKSVEDLKEIFKADEELKQFCLYDINNEKKRSIDTILLIKFNRLKALLNSFTISTHSFEDITNDQKKAVKIEVKTENILNEKKENHKLFSPEKDALINILFKLKNLIFTLANSKMKQVYAGMSLGPELASLLMQVDSAINCIYHYKEGTQFKGKNIDFNEVKKELNEFKKKSEKYRSNNKKEVSAKEIITKLINNSKNANDKNLTNAMKNEDEKMKFLNDNLNTPFKKLDEKMKEKIIAKLIEAFNECVPILEKIDLEYNLK